jgi:hypothetical protein
MVVEKDGCVLGVIVCVVDAQHHQRCYFMSEMSSKIEIIAMHLMQLPGLIVHNEDDTFQCPKFCAENLKASVLQSHDNSHCQKDNGFKCKKLSNLHDSGQPLR